jgi:hypothetical protein
MEVSFVFEHFLEKKNTPEKLCTRNDADPKNNACKEDLQTHGWPVTISQ